jgi:hypothetical protein
VLTRLNAIDGVQSSSALLPNDGKRLVQIRIRRGAKETKVVEEVQKTLRAEIHHETPTQLQGKSADAVGRTQDWLTINQLNSLAATEETSSPQLDKGYLLLAVTVLLALGAFFSWFLRWQRGVRQGGDVRLGSPTPPIAGSI